MVVVVPKDAQDEFEAPATVEDINCSLRPELREPAGAGHRHQHHAGHRQAVGRGGDSAARAGDHGPLFVDPTNAALLDQQDKAKRCLDEPLDKTCGNDIARVR